MVASCFVRQLRTELGALSIKLDRTWRAGGAVAFAQRGDRRIVASTLLPRAAAVSR